MLEYLIFSPFIIHLCCQLSVFALDNHAIHAQVISQQIINSVYNKINVIKSKPYFVANTGKSSFYRLGPKWFQTVWTEFSRGTPARSLPLLQYSSPPFFICTFPMFATVSEVIIPLFHSLCPRTSGWMYLAALPYFSCGFFFLIYLFYFFNFLLMRNSRCSP